MSQDEFNGLVVTPKALSFILGVLSFITAMWLVVSYAKDQEYMIKANSADIIELQDQNKQVVLRLDRLNDLVGELVFIVKGAPAKAFLGGKSSFQTDLSIDAGISKETKNN